MATATQAPPMGFTTKRSEAMPKATLFGSSLEIQDDDNARSVRSLDPNKVKLPRTPPVKGKGQQFVLPEEVKRGLPQADVLERSKQGFGEQKNKTCSIISDLKKKEEEALYTRTQTGDQTARTGQETSRSQWFTEKDLHGSKEINVVGLNKNQSYNRDKYGQRAPTHNYSLIGDVLRPGMDFPRRERTEIQMRNQGYGQGDLKGALAQEYKPPSRARGVAASAGTPRRASLDLPPNIKHQFGSRECDKLLADRAVVDRTLKKQNDQKTASQRPSKPFKVPAFTKEMNPEYEMLGNSLRMNVVPGYSIDQAFSTTKNSFNDQVHLFRYKDPDKWRYQKDELSKWAEHNVLRQRMTKAWEQYFIETLQKKAGK